MTWNDFEVFDDYFHIFNHPKLYRIFENKCMTKEFKYLKRHEEYLNKKRGYLELNFVEEIA